MKKILLTGFDPFGGEKINPAWEAVRLLDDEIEGILVRKLMIPTVFGEAARCVLKEAESFAPDAVVMVGQAGGRKALSAECFAVNLRDARICDNAGQKPRNERIVEGGPEAYRETIGCHRIVEAMKAEGYAIELSYSAGTFVCNDVFYTVLRAAEGTPVRVGFIHVPYIREQAREGVPYMELADVSRALSRIAQLAV